MPVDPIRQTMDAFCHYDPNDDGDWAIDTLDYLPFEDPEEEIRADARLVLVLVESRLLDTLPDGLPWDEDLPARLRRLKADLRLEGLFSRFIKARVYAGQRHQDGRTLLAMRSFLTAVRTELPRLQGVILVGAFPEAMLVRLFMWRKNNLNFQVGDTMHEGVNILCAVPQIVAHRADLVLGDLTGDWDAIYREAPSQIPSWEAIPDPTMGDDWPRANTVFKSTEFHFETSPFQDFFWIKDAVYALLASPPEQPDRIWAQIHHLRFNPELAADDRLLPNPIARPDVAVSRINAYNVAVRPDPAVVGTDGRCFLDANGEPQAFHTNQDLDLLGEGMVRDPVLERRLLVEYFDRNHQYRSGAFLDLPYRTAAIAAEEFHAGEMDAYLARASNVFAPSIAVEHASLLEYVHWLQRPAVLRGIECHGTPWHTWYEEDYQAADLEAAAGGKPWRWIRDGNEVRPSFEELGKFADVFLHKTLWYNRVLHGTGASVVVHTPCEANSPARAADLPYNAALYATWQNAEGILFYLNTVAVIARAKEFNDYPTGFTAALGSSPHTTLGDAWKATFENEVGDASLAEDNNSVIAKRSYPWSLLGDWTLCMDEWDVYSPWKLVLALSRIGKAPPAAGRPAAYPWEGHPTQHVIYRGVDGRIHELWRDDDSGWHHADLSEQTGAPPAVGNPAGYAWDAHSTQHVIFRGIDGSIHELRWSEDANWNHEDLSGQTGAPPAEGDPIGYAWEGHPTQHVIYRGVDGHIHELWWSEDANWNHENLTGQTGAPLAAGDPAGYVWEGHPTQHVVYRGVDGHIHELWWSEDANWNHENLTWQTGAPLAVGNPAGSAWEGRPTQHVVYQGIDGRIHELWWSEDANWNHEDLSGQTGAPPAAGDLAGYAWERDHTQHVVYRGVDDRIHELWWHEDSGWQHADLSGQTGAPPAAGDPAGYAWEGGGTQHVAYRGVDNQIHELWYRSRNYVP
jgi:hypothetical protein